MPDEVHQDAKPRLGDRLSLWGYRALCALLRVTDVRAVALFGRGAGYLVWLCAPSRRRIVARNLRIVVDPMLATGNSAAAAVQRLKEKCNPKSIKFMCLLAAPEGVKTMQEAHPDVDLYIGAQDDHLNEHAYIVPGLGDAGDRIFGTK